MNTSTDEMWKRDEAHIREAMARQSSSAQAPVENREASQLVGSGSLVVLGLMSAEDLAARWERFATDFQSYGERRKTAHIRERWIAQAKVFRHCAEEIRRRMASANERQPQHNASSEPAGQNAPKTDGPSEKCAT